MSWLPSWLPNSVNYCILTYGSGPEFAVLGLVMSISGFVFVLSICRAELDPVLGDHSPIGVFDTSACCTVYRPSRVLLGDRARSTPSLTVEFDWGAATRSSGT